MDAKECGWRGPFRIATYVRNQCVKFLFIRSQYHDKSGEEQKVHQEEVNTRIYRQPTREKKGKRRELGTPSAIYKFALTFHSSSPLPAPPRSASMPLHPQNLIPEKLERML